MNECRRTQHVFFGTILHGVHIVKFIEVCAAFVENIKIEVFCRESQINEKTTYSYYKLLRSRIAEYYNIDGIQLGGSEMVV